MNLFSTKELTQIVQGMITFLGELSIFLLFNTFIRVTLLTPSINSLGYPIWAKQASCKFTNYSFY